MGGADLIDSTWLDGTISLVDYEGQSLVFQHPSKSRRTYALADAGGASTTYPLMTPDQTSDTTLVLTGTGINARLTYSEGDKTRTTFAPLATPNALTETEWAPLSVVNLQGSSTFYGRDATGRITRIVTVPAGMSSSDCPTTGTASQSGSRAAISSLAKGCRALDINYATATTATSTTPGNIAGQVASIQAVMWNGTSMAATTVASYKYDASKRLVSVTDSRAGLTTSYGWQTDSTRLASITPPGLAAFRFTYDSTGADYPRLQRVLRDPANVGGSRATLFSYVYGIDPSASGGALPNLGPTAVSRWHQDSAPSTGYAVFGPDRAITSATPAGVAADDWPYASLSYVDGDGYEVNNAAYGAGRWQISATDYDAEGRVTRELTSSAINQILSDGSYSRDQVDALSTQTDYSSAGLITDVWSPARVAAAGWEPRQSIRPHVRTVYDEEAPNAGLNPITDTSYGLPTTVTVHAAETASTAKGADLDTLSITKNGYEQVPGTSGNGWDLGVPTSVTRKDPWGFDPGPDVTAIEALNSQGQVVESRQPKSSGSDAGTQLNIYFTVAPNSTHPECGNKPEWAASLCKTVPAGAPTSGPELHSTRFTYDSWLQPVAVTDDAGTSERTTTTSYDSAGRVRTTKTTAGIVGSTALPGTYTAYEPLTGLISHTGELVEGPAAHATKRTTYQYDLWGRETSTKTDLGDIKTRSYDSAGRVAAETSTPANAVLAPQTTTYSYDGTDAEGKVERRGLLTKQTVTRSGSDALIWAAAYDADGAMTRQDLPGRVTLREEHDLSGTATQRSYSGQITPVTESTDPETGDLSWEPGTPVDDQAWVAWSTYSDALGRTTQEFNGAGSAFEGVPGVTQPDDASAPSTGRAIAADKTFSYDYLGRLARVTDRTAVGTGTTATPDDWYSSQLPCTQRAYDFDVNSNRTSLKTTISPQGNCFSTTPTTATEYKYDTADRPTHAGQTGGNTSLDAYVVDVFGRQTTLPAADAPIPSLGDYHLSYYDNDRPRSIQAGTHSVVYTLDSQGRRQQLTSTVNGAVQSRLINHYTDDSDSPEWAEAKDANGTSTHRRYVSDLAGALGATLSAAGAEMALINPHGDLVSTYVIPAGQSTSHAASGISRWTDYTEFGADKQGSPDPSDNEYGWGGAAQRQTSRLFTAGLTNMGARWYNSTRGLFTSPDPILGGNSSAYTYPSDPINWQDLDGEALDPRGSGARPPGASGASLGGPKINPGQTRSIGAGISVTGRYASSAALRNMSRAGRKVKLSRYKKNGLLTSGSLGRIGEAAAKSYLHRAYGWKGVQYVRNSGRQGERYFDLVHRVNNQTYYFEVKVNGARLTRAQADYARRWAKQSGGPNVRYIHLTVDRWSGKVTRIATGGDWSF